MNTQTDRAELVSAVERIGAALEQANADVAFLQRLKTAETDAKRLASELRTAQDELAEAMASDFTAKLDARFAGLKDVTVTESVPEGATSVLHNKFLVTVTRSVFDGTSRFEDQTFVGLKGVPSDALEYLIQRRPERMPASIMELAPNDPGEALEVYFAGLRRGHLSVRAA